MGSERTQRITEAVRPTSMCCVVRRATSSLVIFLSIVGACACTGGSSAHAPGSVSLLPGPRARAICQRHFAHVQQAMLTTVAGVTDIGPRPVASSPGPLDRYKPGDAVALCLIPDGPGKHNAVAVVLADGRSYTRWTQNTGYQFTFPG